MNMLVTLLLGFTSVIVGIASSPVESVLFLVATFFVSSLSLLFLGLEFLSLLFIVIYIGAIAVLFLFVVMMRDLKDNQTNDPLTGSMGFLFLIFIPVAYNSMNISTSSLLTNNDLSSIEEIGQVLYTEYYLFYLVAGFILLVSLIGAIVLAVPRPYSKLSLKEDLSSQLNRDASDAIFTVQKRFTL